MIKLLKKNKVFSICLIATILTLILGVFFNALLDDDMKATIASNVNGMINGIDKNSSNIKLIIKTCFNNFTLVSFLWIFGMAVIGIPIVLFIYLLKVFIFSFEFINLIGVLKLKSLLFIIVYLLPSLLNLLILFILVYYSINYSIVLIRLIFKKRNYNIKTITTRYLKVYFLCILCSTVSALIESIIVPKILLVLV